MTTTPTLADVTRGELTDLYHTQRLSLAAIAARFGVDRSVVRRRMRALGVEVRTPNGHGRGWAVVLTAEFLHDAYVTDGKSMKRIAAEVGCGKTTVERYLVQHGFAIDPDRGHQLDAQLAAVLTLEFLLTERIINGQACDDIGRQVGCSARTVRDALARHGLPTARPPAVPQLCDARWLFARLYGNRSGVRQLADVLGCVKWRVTDAQRRLRRIGQWAALEDEWAAADAEARAAWRQAPAATTWWAHATG